MVTYREFVSERMRGHGGSRAQMNARMRQCAAEWRALKAGGTRAPRRSARARKPVKAGAGRRRGRKAGNGFFGSLLGGLGGNLIGKLTGNADRGQRIGSAVGGFLPF